MEKNLRVKRNEMIEESGEMKREMNGEIIRNKHYYHIQ